AEARALDAWCREHLPGAERPRGFVRLSELPTLGSGKRDRVRLRELVLALGDNDDWSANERE
ncbi:MAG: hypothetical protein WAK53_04585, partial [Chromatiaceae bacterium]